MPNIVSVNTTMLGMKTEKKIQKIYVSMAQMGEQIHEWNA